MALTCGFYNSIYGDRKYSAIQLSSIFDGIIKDGIFATVGDAFTVSAGSEMQVIVGPGRAWFNHSWTLNDANLPIEVDDAEVVLDRIDAVVIEVNSDDSVRDNTVKMVKGRPSSEPEKPELLDTETVHQYALAYVTVRSGVTEITNADIENAVGTTETPFITGLLETIDATELMNQWNGQFQDWLREAGTSLEDWETQSTSLMAQWTVEFEDWFKHLQNELDENQAAHLQHQIDELRVKSGMSAKILINSDPGSTVTITKPDGTVVVATQVLGTTTQWECSTGDYGVHYIHSVLNGEDAQVSLNVDTCKIYTIDDDHMHADITVTFPQGFSCRCQGGSENLYATSNPFTFVVHNKTTYTITASAPGITYTETVEITASGQTESIFCPSVENAPTDDVQMWLYFGGITDKAYTTLSEVLDDSTTLATLIADNNAVDYMVRSKSWCGVGLVPKMTSNTTPSGVCSGTNMLSGYDYYYAFNDDYTLTFNSTSGGIIQYQFPSPVMLNSYTISPMSDAQYASRFPNTSKCEVSTNGSDWTEISNVTLPYTQGSTTKVSAISSGAISYVRLTLSGTKGGTSYTQCHNIQFYSENICDNSTAMTYIGLNNYASNTLIADSDWLNAICNSAYFESVLNVKVPTMTGNTTPSGEVLFDSSKTSGGTSANTYYYLFDDNLTNAVGTSTSVTSQYFGYDFVTEVLLLLVKVYGLYDSGTVSIVIQGYNGNSWVDIVDLGAYTESQNWQTFPIGNNNKYSKLRANCTKGTASSIAFRELQFYGRQDV